MSNYSILKADAGSNDLFIDSYEIAEEILEQFPEGISLKGLFAGARLYYILTITLSLNFTRLS